MNLDLYLLMAYVLTIVLFLGTPGPVTLLVIHSSIRGGFKAGLASVAGTNMASLVLIGFSFLTIQNALAVSENALLWLTLFGSFYILFFSYQIMKSSISLQTKNTETHKNYFKHAFMVGISNPKDILFFIAFFPSFFSVTSRPYLSMFILIGIWILLDYSILLLYSLFFSKMINESIANKISQLSGFILFLLGCYAIYSAVSALFIY